MLMHKLPWDFLMNGLEIPILIIARIQKQKTSLPPLDWDQIDFIHCLNSCFSTKLPIDIPTVFVIIYCR